MADFRSLGSPRALRILTIAGVLLGVFATADLVQEQRLLGDAEEVPAFVESAEVESYGVGTGTARERRYRPLIRFRYVAEGLERSSRRVTPLDRGGSRAWAEALVAAHPPGSRATCWVPPGAPDEAYLVRERDWKPPVGMGVGYGLALVAGFLWFRRRADPAARAGTPGAARA